MLSKKPNWSHAKAALNKMSKADVLAICKDLYQLSTDNKDFFQSRLALVPSSQKLYKKKIRDSFNPDFLSGEDYDLERAEQAVNEYIRAVSEPEKVADLMLYYVECGNSYTLEYGDIDEGFYEDIAEMYKKAVKEVMKIKKSKQAAFRKRLKKIMTSSEGIGWGYHDDIGDIYYEAFENGK